jgi:hypothetical protein
MFKLGSRESRLGGLARGLSLQPLPVIFPFKQQSRESQLHPMMLSYITGEVDTEKDNNGYVVFK